MFVLYSKLCQKFLVKTPWALEEANVKDPVTFNLFVTRDLNCFQLYNPPLIGTSGEYFPAYAPEMINGSDYRNSYYKDVFLLPKSLDISPNPLSIAVYIKDSKILDLKRKCEKVLIAAASNLATESTTISTKMTTAQKTKRSTTKDPNILFTNSIGSANTIFTNRRTTQEESSTTEASVISTTPFRSTSAAFTSQDTTEEEGSTTDAVISTTRFRSTSAAFTSQDATEEESSTTDAVISTTPVGSMSTAFTTQDTTEEESSMFAAERVKKSTIEDLNIGPTVDETTEAVIMPSSQGSKLSTMLGGLLSVLSALIGIYIFRNRKKRSYYPIDGKRSII